jgi:hypothetical protein
LSESGYISRQDAKLAKAPPNPVFILNLATFAALREIVLIRILFSYLTLALWEREWVRVDRQGESKLAAFPHLALHPDPPPVQLHKLLGQR